MDGKKGITAKALGQWFLRQQKTSVQTTDSSWVSGADGANGPFHLPTAPCSQHHLCDAASVLSISSSPSTSSCCSLSQSSSSSTSPQSSSRLTNEVCMYVCKHVYMCAYACVCTHLCMYALCVYPFVHVCMYTSMCACMYVCMYVCYSCKVQEADLGFQGLGFQSLFIILLISHNPTWSDTYIMPHRNSQEKEAERVFEQRLS